MKELNARSLLLGVVLSLFFAMSSTYVGLYAGMTISASVPAAVLSVVFLRRATILEHNIVQTTASAGESLAAGIIFTMPALLLSKAMVELPWYLVTGVGLLGGILGIVAMIWIRRPLIVERDKELTYPEGRACARMLQLFMNKGASIKPLLAFVGVGAGMKVLNGLLGIFRETATLVNVTVRGRTLPLVQGDISPALLAVGVIIGTNAAMLVLVGGVVNTVVQPLYVLAHADLDPDTNLRLVARFLGIGAMVVSAFYSLVTITRELIRSERSKRAAHHEQRSEDGPAAGTDQDIRGGHQVLIASICVLLIFALYWHISQVMGLSLASTLGIVVASGFFALVASYTVGQVGSTSNPVSGMTISGLLFSCLLLLPFSSSLLGTEPVALDAGAKTVLLVIAGVVCCAACTAGAVSQDLKTGQLLGATPRAQQWAMIIGTISASLVLQPLLMHLHHGYGIGDKLSAPQAGLFASLVEAFLRWLKGEGLMHGDMILIGAILGVVLALADARLKKMSAEGRRVFRLYPMATAVGIYLGIGLALPIALGGLIAFYIGRKVVPQGESLPMIAGKDDDERNLELTPRREFHAEVESHFTIPAAGLIAGEAIVGIGLAALVAAGGGFPILHDAAWLDSMAFDWLSFLALAGLALGLTLFVKHASRKSLDAASRRSS
ncbi:MAG: oligopeptide transporter, OPT family [Planctomycetes bacterium]|nr:oligopeptide transporter, OPT family [Planctomycetota bacterium]MCB9891790.1 oligopeptide transporter, OPT family [Planctomycetota bacterium]